MNIVVLGATGMLGHVAAFYFKEKYGRKIILCARKKTGIPFLDQKLNQFDLSDLSYVQKFIEQHRPCCIVNCAGVVDQDSPEEIMQFMNVHMPKRIAEYLHAKQDNSRLVHISTDGVFSGEKGDYTESSTPDCQNFYGRSKLAGEVVGNNHLTIRTSIIGPGLYSKKGLFDWFMAQQKEVHGYRKVIWTGVTTLELAKFIDYAVEKEIKGLFHLASEKISKYDLLLLINQVFQKGIFVAPDDILVCDRSLKTIRKDVEYQIPIHREMLEDLRTWMAQHSNKK